MKADLYCIPVPWLGHLAISSRPRGGDWLEDEVCGWRQSKLDMIVSLLTSDEIATLELMREAELCRAHGLEILVFPIIDRSVPSSRTATFDFAQKIHDALVNGKNVLIHCRQGIGRAALIAACLLVLSGVDPDDAFREISLARGVPVPETPEQKKWVIDFTNSFAPRFV